MKASVPHEKYGEFPAYYAYDTCRWVVSERSITRCIQIFEEVKTVDWSHDLIAGIFRDTRTALAFTSKEVMTPLRHAITGMRVGSVRNRIHV
jgi:hypothetical protein